MSRYLTHIIVLVFIFFNIPTFIFAQFPMGGKAGPIIKGKIEGIIKDSITNLPIAYATVTLKKNKSVVILDGTLSEDDGSFKFENVKTGIYTVEVDFIGYNPIKINDLQTTLKDPDLKIPPVILSPSQVILESIEITEERSLFENKADRLVFNAENDASISGGDATDVLRKVPLLSVDLNGNVSLRGSQNVQILINGKPSGMFSSNIADALKMFPADQIQKVEVITSPSAKYDAEGSAGIINIITKKKNIDGLAGSVNASVGIRQNSLFLNLNSGKGRFGLTSNGALFYSNPANGKTLFNRIDTTAMGIRTLSQEGTQRTSRLGGNGSLSAFYDINGYNSINSSLTFRGFGFDLKGGLDGQVNDPVISVINSFERQNKGNNFFGGFDWNTDYTRKFENREGQELSMAVQYSRQDNDQEFYIQESHDQLLLLNRNDSIINAGINHEVTAQIDYTHPLNKNTKFETGAKTIIRKIISDYNTTILGGNGYVPIIEKFTYNQDVYAGYASINFVVAQKYNLITGLRYEHTGFNGDFTIANEDDFDTRTYANFLPNMTISRTFSGFRTLKIGYSQRIQRPNLRFINPFNNNSDFLNRTIGNPNLDPEIVHQVEMSYNFTFKGFTTFSALFYKYTDGIIEQILSVDASGPSVNTFQNIGTNNSIGLNTFVSKTINTVTIRTGGNLSTYDATGVVNGNSISRQSYEYNLFLNGDIKISGSLKMDFFGFFRSPVRTIQGDNPAFTIYGMGFRKEFKNSSVGITLIEPFQNDKFFNSDVSGQGFSQQTSFSIPFRSIGINYRYKFGKVDFTERKTKVKNNDQKSGGDDMQGGGFNGGSRNN